VGRELRWRATSVGEGMRSRGVGRELRWETSVLVPALPRLSLTSASVSASGPLSVTGTLTSHW